MIIRTAAEKDFIPTYAHASDAGADLRACVDEEVKLWLGDRKTIPTGVRVELPANIAGFVRSRSGLAKNHGVVALEGTIDPGYRGEIGITMINHGDRPYIIKRGDRIAQLVLVPVVHGTFIQAEKLSDSDRGESGFGASGR